ncbi:MAG: hypothetical protein NZ853_11275 [Leptospiraceae bacterium]|nr:hypothetical protein [Leptospiraceae bacterium]MDW7975462.1 hypothetical protein [Leptospiraceae bacterium]
MAINKKNILGISHYTDFFIMIRISGLHPQLQPMVDRGQLGARKIVALLNLKEFVDKYAKVPYISEEEVQFLEQKYGAKPDIITWGDYFQTEIASRFFYQSDEDFEKIIETIKFDIISSILIFKNKSEEFKNKIKEEALVLKGLEKEKYTDEEETILHLEILLQYYEEMGLSMADIFDEDYEWFYSFVDTYEKKAI